MANRTYHPRGELIDGLSVREHPLHMTWANMHSRCSNETDPGFKNYGGRGIKVCDRWNHFKNFVADMGSKPTPEHTLERKDNSLGYSPENCTWATRTEQCLNRRTFSNNTTGARGVVKVGNGRYQARFDFEGVRYTVGRFDTKDDAASAREKFIDLFLSDRAAAIASISGERVWVTSSTKVRGIVPHKGGGYMARCTINGERIYLGYFKTIEEASNARQQRLAHTA